ncbi:DNA repair/recombination protein Rec2 [Mycosarcoma maydis]|uniref:DNA repair/recombination protein Rec2 n=1 Tax=Mycosarcoma maydis TaxID=5270 RepID=Q99131_MYCMD|nr:DNA repair/recombination protein Rec2 [Ustilago maydis 521]AAA64741.1 REC2 protein [Ustilago maydis]KIS69120.1 DNA repair/recombination protein Rec2 [Ustilago maydis 521]|eukprot:XP_011389452.1 DNA repair/recombination protein Rec2 [Ustilago maydis 521]
MTGIAIADVGCISKRIKACCRRAKLFSTDEILLSPPQQLAHVLRISQADADLLLLQVATASAPPPISVLDALNGKLPATNLDQNFFDAVAAADDDDDDNDDDDDKADSGSADASDTSDADDQHLNDARFASSCIVPPTQGYDGNFPGAQCFVYDSDAGSDSDARSSIDAVMHEDIELPSTFCRPQTPQTHDVARDEHHDGYLCDPKVDHASVARDVLSLGRQRHVFSSGSRELDDLLGGGVRSAVLTELVGESGSGKTQMAIQVCTYAALGLVPLSQADDHDKGNNTFQSRTFVRDPIHASTKDDTLSDILQSYGMEPSIGSHRGMGACYITSGGERAAHSIVNRALELASFAINERFDRVYPVCDPTQSSQDADGRRDALLAKAQQLGRRQALANLHIACVADVEALEHALKYSLPGLIRRLWSSKRQSGVSREIGVVVVDNLPALFQQDQAAASDIDSLFQRSKMLVEIADALKRISAVQWRGASDCGSSAGRAVLVLNHVSDAFGIDKQIARRFVFDSAHRIRTRRSHFARNDPGTSSQAPTSAFSGGTGSALPDQPLAMDVASQTAFTSGLLASIAPTLAEAVGARELDSACASNDVPLRTLEARTAQLGQTWSNLINVRVFLSKTRARICMRDDQAPACEPVRQNTNQRGTASKSLMNTVRKAAVVINPFGATMLDVGVDKSALRQLRFVITPRKAVHVLNAYPSTVMHAMHATADSTPAPESQQQQRAAERHPAEQEDADQDLFGEALQEHHWLAIDELQSHTTARPTSRAAQAG